MRRIREAAVRRRTRPVTQKERTRSTERMMRTKTMMTSRTKIRDKEMLVAAEVKVVRKERERCETRRRSSAVTTTVTTSRRKTQKPEVAEMKAAAVRTKERTGAEAGAAAGVAVRRPLTVTVAVSIQRAEVRAGAGVGVKEAQTPVTPVTVNKVCGRYDSVSYLYIFNFQTVEATSVWLTL